MIMNNSYISILTTDNYVFGALVLWKSLMDTQPKYPFHLLITPNLSKETMNLLEITKIKLIKINPIKNPILNDPSDRRYYNYSKLNMWSLTQFDKIVYLDADMIILHNIDELFEKKNMSSTNSGGWLPDKNNWKEMNSGMIVLEPSATLFEHMKSKVGLIEKEVGKGDQAFLHQYYHDWHEKTDLHLPHIYNIFDIHLKGYKKNFGYYLDTNIQFNNKNYDDKRVKIVHFIGQKKPWNIVDEIKARIEIDEEWEAKKLWVKIFKDVKKNLLETLSLKK